MYKTRFIVHMKFNIKLGQDNRFSIAIKAFYTPTIAYDPHEYLFLLLSKRMEYAEIRCRVSE